MERYGMALRLKAEAAQSYKEYHAAVWPGVLEVIYDCNIRNYSIFLHAGVLYAYYEYHGADYAADMTKMAASEITKEWWKIMDPMQEPLPTAGPGEWWTRLEEVFHVD